MFSEMNLFVYTLGCRVNQCESEAIAQSFEKSGWRILKSVTDADLVIINTCTVTGKAEQKGRRMIRLFAKVCPVVVTGCYADECLTDISDNIVIIPISRKPDLLKLPSYIEGNDILSSLKAFASEKNRPLYSEFDYAATGFSYHCRSYLKIQDGCDNNCGFCRTHIARGKSSFLKPEIAVQRALEIEKAGYHEIILTGVNLTMYDHDGEGLGGLLEKMLEVLGPDIRIRLSSMEPDHIDDRLINCLKDYRMQPYFHIPVQSASDKVIKRANRHYSNEHLEYVVKRIRQIKDDPLLACDLITGLPSEEEEDFEITKRFLKENGFSLFHVFPFSPRPDTELFKAKDRVCESVRDKRAEELRKISNQSYRTYVERQIGKENEVILEDYKDGLWYGLTGNYIRVRVQGVPEDSHCGDLKKVIMKSFDTAECI